jgi:DNA-binding transcriptional MerR regulator
MTIDELAHRSGTTTRNIRAYQERGLVPPPRLAGRVGYYNETHLARLKHIAELSERGFSLAAVRELFTAWEQGYGLAEVLGFEEALAAPWDSGGGAPVTVAELRQRLGADADAISRAVQLGILLPDPADPDCYRVPSAQLLDAGAELVATGVPLERVLDEAARLRDDLDRIAGRMVGLFREYVWQPYDEAGRPPDELPGITEALNRARPVAWMAIGPLFAQAMADRLRRTAAETLVEGPKPKKRASKKADAKKAMAKTAARAAKKPTPRSRGID